MQVKLVGGVLLGVVLCVASCSSSGSGGAPPSGSGSASAVRSGVYTDVQCSEWLSWSASDQTLAAKEHSWKAGPAGWLRRRRP